MEEKSPDEMTAEEKTEAQEKLREKMRRITTGAEAAILAGRAAEAGSSPMDKELENVKEQQEEAAQVEIRVKKQPPLGRPKR